jgi:hypothetical protein
MRDGELGPLERREAGSLLGQRLPTPIGGDDGRSIAQGTDDLFDGIESGGSGLVVLARASPEQRDRCAGAQDPADLTEGAGRVEMMNALPTTTASPTPSSSGIASAVPSTTKTPGRRDAKTARMFDAGSTASSRTPSFANSLESWPVPAARSTTRERWSRRLLAATQATASGAYPGLSAS